MQHSLKRLFKSVRAPSSISLFPTLLIIGAFIVGWLSRTWYDQVVVTPVPNPEEAVMEEPQQLRVVYVVQSGDSLWKLAEQTYGDGSRASEIAAANQLPADAMLEVGQELTIPVPQFPTGETGEVDDGQSIEVQSGDTLWSLAETHLGSGYRWSELYSANMSVIGSNPDRIFAGQTLSLPAGAAS
jgi:nucleoid-associated protein YgaU